MADAGTLISNRGDAGLGFGSTAGIPVSGGKDLNAVNQAGRDATLLSIDQQRQLFNQKVSDHNKLLSLLSEDQIKVGDMLDRDRPVVKKVLDDVDVAFAERAKKGFNNIDATVNYNKAVRKAKDAVTQAQARYVVDKQVQQDAANELPSERESILKEHNNYLNGFWNDYTPHVKAITIDHPGMTSSILRDSLVPNSGVPSQQQTVRKTITKNVNGKLTTIDVETNQPVKAGTTGKVGAAQTGNGISMFTTTPGKFYDYQKMVSNASDDFHDEKQRLNQTKYMDFVLNQTDPSQLKSIIDHANDRISDYNRQRGLNESSSGYVDPVEIIVAPDGTRHTNLSVPEFNAKLALASVNGDYVEKDKLSLDKDAAKYLIDQQKADTDSLYKRAMAAAANTKAAAYAQNLRQQMKFRKTAEEQDAFLDEMWKRNLNQQPTLIKGEGDNKVSLAPIEAQNSLPVFTLDGKTPKQLIPIGGVQKVGANGKIYYEGGHFDPVYRLGDKDVGVEEINTIYQNFKKNLGSTWNGGINDFIKQAVDAGKFRVLLKGANGTTDEELSRAAQRIISNTNTKKGQEEIFSDIPTDDQIPDNNQ